MGNRERVSGRGRRASGRAISSGAAADQNTWGVAVKLLAMRAHSTQEIRERLGRRGYPADAIEAVVAKLTASGYLNDAVYARTWAQSRAHRRPVGPARLADELRSRGVSELEISATLSELSAEQDIREVAEAAAARKLPRLRTLPPDVARRRLGAYLTRQGFAAEVVLALCRKYFPNEEGPPTADR